MSLEDFILAQIEAIDARLHNFETQQKLIVEYLDAVPLPLDDETSAFLLRGRLRARVLEFFGPAILQTTLESKTLTRVLKEYKELKNEIC